MYSRAFITPCGDRDLFIDVSWNNSSHARFALLDDPGNYGQGGNGYGRGGKRGGFQRRNVEEKVPDSVIEERIQRERPCRTLFIRNVKASITYTISAAQGHALLRQFDG